MSTNKAGKALTARIHEIAKNHFGGDEHYLARAAFGNLVLEDHLAALQGFDPGRLTDPETVRTLLELSKLIDCVQDSTANLVGPAQDAGYVSERFLRFAAQVEFGRSPRSDDEQKAYERALDVLYLDREAGVKTDDYARFTLARSDLMAKRIELLEKQRQLGDTQDIERESVEFEIAELKELVEGIEQLLDALDRQHGFSDAERVKDRAERRSTGFPEQVQTALDTDLNLFQLSEANSQEVVIESSFFPAGLADDNWASIRLSNREIAQLAPGAGPVSLEDLAILDKAKLEALECDIQMLSVERPWFWPELFENHHWRLAGQGGPVSDGKGGGRLPAYVTGLVFGRNLKVHGTVAGPGGGKPITLRPAITTTLVRPSVVLTQGTQVKFKGPARPKIAAKTFVTTPVNAKFVARTNINRRGAKKSRGAGRINIAKPAVQTRQMGSMVKFNAAKLNPGLIATVKLMSSIKGRVTAPNGRPVGRAKVTVKQLPKGNPVTKICGADGQFDIPVFGRGRVRIQVQRPGFKPLRREVAINPNTNLNLRLQPIARSHHLTIKLFDPLGQPFGGNVSVLIKPVTGGTRPIRQASAGRPELRMPLVQGNYDIAVASTGARKITPNRMRVAMNAARTVKVTIDTGLLLEDPAVQLLGFVCRNVPLAPDPAPGIFES